MLTIQELLMKYTKDEMEMAAMQLGLPLRRKNARKAEWADMIARGMQEEPERVRMLLTLAQIRAIRDQMERGEDVSTEDAENHEDLWDGLLTLMRFGLVSRECSLWRIQPCLQSMLSMTEADEEEHKLFDVIANLIVGWLIHVGMMPLEKLIDCISDQLEPEEEAKEEIRSVIFALLIARRGSGCLFPDEHDEPWVVHEDVDDPDVLLCRLQEAHVSALSYPEYDAEALLFSALYTHLPGDLSLYEPLKQWLDRHDADEDAFEDAIETMVYLAQNDDIDEAINSVMELVAPRDLKDANLCAKACQKVLNSIPRWCNKGHSPESFRKDLQPLRRSPLPGRNNPCPCGSGKKYKQCCGRRMN